MRDRKVQLERSRREKLRKDSAVALQELDQKIDKVLNDLESLWVRVKTLEETNG
jgi:hypothetical protein